MPDFAQWLDTIPDGMRPLLTLAIALVVAIGFALIVHRISFAILTRLAASNSSQSDDILIARIRRPCRWIFIAIAMVFAERLAPLETWAAGKWEQAIGFIVPGLIGWLALSILQAFAEVVRLKSDLSAPDNLAARRRHTRIGLLARVGTFLILFLTLCMMLMTIPSIRSIGVTLIASAGLAGLAVGAAAQPALKNLIAGIQLAFTEPIRIDDVVIVNNEWGRIEEIRLTFVVVKLWDERRLVVPISKFLEESFQNWTRETSQLLGSVLWHLDPSTDIAKLRGALEPIVRHNPRWDGRFFNLQVIEMTHDAIQVRALVTARNAEEAFDLRCDVREAILAFIRAEMPEALPHKRQYNQTELSASSGA